VILFASRAYFSAIAFVRPLTFGWRSIRASKISSVDFLTYSSIFEGGSCFGHFIVGSSVSESGCVFIDVEGAYFEFGNVE